jgi:hypothetical protein
MSPPPVEASLRAEPSRAEAAAAAARLGEADALLADVLDLAAARPLALDALVAVSAVQWSAEVATACVECADRPRILLNPCFVERFCGTRERMAMLVLHELSHISFGHTRLYPRPTLAHNFAFDALINAGLLASLARRGEDPEPYAALPMEVYEAAESPWFLLRPPPGWPEQPDWRASTGSPRALREIHRRLYARPVDRGSEVLDLTYGEIVAELRSAGPAGTALPGLEGEADDAVLRRLLGAHGGTAHERSASSSGRDAHAARELGAVLDGLDLQDGAKGAGAGREPYALTVARRERERALEQALARLLRRVFVDDLARTARWTSVSVPAVSPDPSRDRRAATRQATARILGAPAPLLFRSEIVHSRPEQRSARLYLDVSGSMGHLLERLHAALVPLRRLLAAEVYAFSTEVFPVERGAFVRGEVQTTGGTSVEPVLHHLSRSAAEGGARGHHKPRALLLTDGHFNAPSHAAVRALATAGAEIHLGVLGAGPLRDQSSWVASATRLPDLLRPATGDPR